MKRAEPDDEGETGRAPKKMKPCPATVAALQRGVAASMSSLAAAVSAISDGTARARVDQEGDGLAAKVKDLTDLADATTAELSEAKELLLRAGADKGLADVLPVRVLCEASDEEIKEALDLGRKCAWKWEFRKGASAVDEAIQDEAFDTFVRADGNITGANQQHPVLVELAVKYGQPSAALIGRDAGGMHYKQTHKKEQRNVHMMHMSVFRAPPTDAPHESPRHVVSSR